MVRPAIAAGLASVCLLSLGCYKHLPADPQSLKPGQEIRVLLNEPGALRLAQEFGMANPVEGGFVAVRADSLDLAVWVGRAFAGTDFSTARQTIPLVRQEITVIQAKRFSRKRTIMFSAAVLGGLVFLSERLGFTEVFFKDDGETTLPPETPPDFRRPVRR